MSKIAYSSKTNDMLAVQVLSHISAAVTPEAFGIFARTLLEVFISIRNSVTSIPILPGMTSIGIKKLMKEASVRVKVGTNKL